MSNLYRSLILLCTLFITADVISQTADGQTSAAHHVPGVILFQMESDVPAERVFSKEIEVGGQMAEVKEVSVVNAPMRIYRLVTDGQVADDRLLDHVRGTQGIAVAQYDHYVENRETLPDDSFIDQQWQYVNTGQSGGLEGADIDMDLAWDITTGGITATGDTIVVCVIDNGIDADHPDIEPALWVNREEIANNGIDDDNNGYIDDVRGWDTGNDNDAVYDGGGHGTPVAGIIGAKGNNGTGVSGVNWDVKLMIVQGGTGVESEVLEAYGYPLIMRQKYNASCGAEGAFVVATNASWGTNFGQPADAPLWCAMYDSLGVAGILNCGATINGNVDVDVQGDLPTACPSDYLISVTNMNHLDAKVSGAGFGATTIDLGAFGAGTFTVASNGNYNGFGGTSGATPHVAGVVALMYSLDCPDLMLLSQTAPAEAAALIRDAIYDGVDSNESLEGITTTGGRLNAHNALNELLASCAGCGLPFAISTQEQEAGVIELSWEVPSDTATFALEYRLLGESDWTLLDDVESPVLFPDLAVCQTLEYRFSTVCLDGPVTGPTCIFTSEGCCEAVSTIDILAVGAETIDLSWPPIPAATTYNVTLTEVGSSLTQSIESPTNQFTLSDLDPCTVYEISILTLCPELPTAVSSTIEVTTIGCGLCGGDDYCQTDVLSTQDEWIASVTIGDITNSSGPSTNGYEDFSLEESGIELSSGETYTCVIEPGYSGQSWVEHYSVFVDVDQNGQFSEDERLATTADATSMGFDSLLVMPQFSNSGETKMRVVMTYLQVPGPCDSPSNFGEYEDYCVTLIGDPTFSSLLESATFNVSIFPNPIEEQLHIQSMESDLVIAAWEIIDLSGRIVLADQVSASSSGAITISTAQLGSGTYLVMIIGTDDRRAVRRIVKN